MKNLSYKEQVELLDSLALKYAKSDNPQLLANFLTRKLYGAKLNDIPSQTEPFKIVSLTTTLTVDNTGSSIIATRPQFERLIKVYREAYDLRKKILKDIRNIGANNPGSIIVGSFNGGISKGLHLTQ